MPKHGTKSHSVDIKNKNGATPAEDEIIILDGESGDEMQIDELEIGKVDEEDKLEEMNFSVEKWQRQKLGEEDMLEGLIFDANRLML